MMLPGMILAGGLSRRMEGREKALLPLAGRPLLSHVIDRVEPQLSHLALNANGDPARLDRFGLLIVPDHLPEGVPDRPGPLAGVLAALDWAAGLGAERVFTIAGDLPFLPGDFVPSLLMAAEGHPGPVLAQSRDATGEMRLHPTCALWPVTLAEDLRGALQAGQRRMMGWAESRGARAVEFAAPGLDPFFNINTPEDLARAQALIEG